MSPIEPATPQGPQERIVSSMPCTEIPRFQPSDSAIRNRMARIPTAASKPTPIARVARRSLKGVSCMAPPVPGVATLKASL